MSISGVLSAMPPNAGPIRIARRAHHVPGHHPNRPHPNHLPVTMMTTAHLLRTGNACS